MVQEQEVGIFSGSYYERDSETYEYYPEIKNGRHHLRAPLLIVDEKIENQNIQDQGKIRT